MPRVVPDLVSTIIPVVNRPQMLGEAVASVLSQTYRPIEIVIVDDGSTDDTTQVAETLTRRYPDVVQLLRQENRGPGPARALGLEAASGEFIQYLDSDDLLAPRKFERQVSALRENPECGIAYCLTLRPDKNGVDAPWAKTGTPFHRILPGFLMERGWGTLTPLWRRSVCDAIGPWGTFRVMEDWEYDCRAGILGVRPIHCPEPLARVRDHDGGRASGMGRGWSRELVRDYWAAHRSIYHRLKEAGLVGLEYMDAFSRKLFWIARMCAAYDLRLEAQEALDTAMEAVRPRRSTVDMRIFRGLATLIGWKTASRFCEGTRRILRKSQ